MKVSVRVIETCVYETVLDVENPHDEDDLEAAWVALDDETVQASAIDHTDRVIEVLAIVDDDRVPPNMALDMLITELDDLYRGLVDQRSASERAGDRATGTNLSNQAYGVYRATQAAKRLRDAYEGKSSGGPLSWLT